MYFNLYYNSHSDNYLYAKIGKFLYRSGFVLMDENTPFTLDNNCKEVEATPTQGDPDLFVSTTLCCAPFQNDYTSN